MFTGIIEGLGTVVGVRPSGLGRRLTIAADFDLSDTKIGASLSVNGACLTAVTLSSRRFQADVSPETLDRTTFKKTQVGDRVNIERALMLTGRLRRASRRWTCGFYRNHQEQKTSWKCNDHHH